MWRIWGLQRWLLIILTLPSIPPLTMRMLSLVDAMAVTPRKDFCTTHALKLLQLNCASLSHFEIFDACQTQRRSPRRSYERSFPKSVTVKTCGGEKCPSQFHKDNEIVAYKKWCIRSSGKWNSDIELNGVFGALPGSHTAMCIVDGVEQFAGLGPMGSNLSVAPATDDGFPIRHELQAIACLVDRVLCLTFQVWNLFNSQSQLEYVREIWISVALYWFSGNEIKHGGYEFSYGMRIFEKKTFIDHLWVSFTRRKLVSFNHPFPLVHCNSWQ